MREDSPCKDCTERFLACSDHCPKDERGEYGYKAWKERYSAQQQHLRDNSYRFSISRSAARDKVRRKYRHGGGYRTKQGGNQ